MSADALHRRVAADIRRRIEAGEWPPGEQMPSRASLGDEYEVHEQTVRLAVVLLRRQGFLEGEARRRLYVAYPPAVRVLTDPNAPWPHESETLEAGRCHADAELAARLAVPVGSVLWRETEECWDPGGRSAMLVTSWRRGRRRRHATAVVELGVTPLGEREAHSLGLTVDTVAYRLLRTRLDSAGVPVETADLVLPMDRWLVRLAP